MSEMPGGLYIGLMSGTSMDGVDAALLRTDGQTVFDFGPTLLSWLERARPDVHAAVIAADRDAFISNYYQALVPLRTLTEKLGADHVWFDNVDTGTAKQYGGVDPRNHTIRRTGTGQAPAITTQPQSTAAVVGGTATFSGASLNAPAGATVKGDSDADTFNLSPSPTTTCSTGWRSSRRSAGADSTHATCVR